MLFKLQYLSLNITTSDEEQRSILVALLDEFGFDTFLEEEDAIIASAPMGAVSDENKEAAGQLLTNWGLEYRFEIEKQQNWNKIWEENYDPIEVDKFCRVKASFHPDKEGFQHQLIIDPKMAFGTGHHATTWMMIFMMQELNFTNKRVLDYGAGTGILAILAEKLNANSIVALEIDEWAMDNLYENISLNQCKKVEVVNGNIENSPSTNYDIVLANINLNVLKDSAKALSNLIQSAGYLVVSGILEGDITEINRTFSQHGFNQLKSMEKDGWCCLQFQKNS